MTIFIRVFLMVEALRSVDFPAQIPQFYGDGLDASSPWSPPPKDF
jgi:hypothetical protein